MKTINNCICGKSVVMISKSDNYGIACFDCSRLVATDDEDLTIKIWNELSLYSKDHP